MDWNIGNLWFSTGDFGVVKENLNELPEEIRECLSQNETVAREFLATKSRKKSYEFYGSSKQEGVEGPVCGNIVLTDEERDELKKRIVEVYNSELREEGEPEAASVDDIAAEAFDALEGKDEAIDRLFDLAEDYDMDQLEGIDLEHHFYLYRFSAYVWDEEKKEMVIYPVLVSLSDEEYLFCLQMRLTFGKSCTFDRLSLMDPELGRNVFAQVDGVRYNFNMPHDFPIMIVADELESDVALIEGKEA